MVLTFDDVTRYVSRFEQLVKDPRKVCRWFSLLVGHVRHRTLKNMAPKAKLVLVSDKWLY